jgi:hypothetical protein
MRDRDKKVLAHLLNTAVSKLAPKVDVTLEK